MSTGLRSSIGDIIGECIAGALGSTSNEAIDAFNSALRKVERQAGWDDYEYMCIVMHFARAELAMAEASS